MQWGKSEFTRFLLLYQVKLYDSKLFSECGDKVTMKISWKIIVDNDRFFQTIYSGKALGDFCL